MTRQQYNNRLQELPVTLADMATEVDRMLGQAMQALADHNSELAEIILREDDIVDELNVEIEHQCIDMIALQQPVGRDLRLIGAAYNIVTDLERIGDHGVDIAKISRKLSLLSKDQTPEDLIRMSVLVRRMLKNLITALQTFDLCYTDTIVSTEPEVNLAYRQFETTSYLSMDHAAPGNVEASYLLFVAHHLEEIADHAVSVANRLRWCVTGQSVRKMAA